MPTIRSTAARIRYTRAANARRVEREHARHIVGIDARPSDDDIVDEVAIDMALRGWRRYAEQLTRAELIAAIQEGERRGIGGPALADLLCLYERQVSTLRARGRMACATSQANAA